MLTRHGSHVTLALALSPILLTAWLAACKSRPPSEKPAAAGQTGLAGTMWRLVQFEGGDGTKLTPDNPAKYTIEFKADSTLLARIDCNRGRGTWKSSGPGLELGPLALTRAACPPGSLHDQLVKHWPYVRSYVLKDGHLFLSLMADGGIYQFEPGAHSAPGAKVEGTAGENQPLVPYQLSGCSLRFSQLVSTLRACVDPELNRQERGFLEALGGTRTWRVTGDHLIRPVPWHGL